MSERPRRNLPPSLAASTGKVAKKCSKKSNAVVRKTKEELQEAMSSIPSKHNTLIVGGGVHNKFLQGISPENFVFVFYDEPKIWPTPGYGPTIEGYSLEDVNAGLCDTTEREHDVVSKLHKFEGEKEKVNVFAVDYNGASYKVKYGSLKENGHPYFFIEYVKDQFNPDPEISGSGIRYYGEFMTRSVPDQGTSSFGKKKKKNNNLSKDLKYLLTL